MEGLMVVSLTWYLSYWRSNIFFWSLSLHTRGEKKVEPTWLNKKKASFYLPTCWSNGDEPVYADILIWKETSVNYQLYDLLSHGKYTNLRNRCLVEEYSSDSVSATVTHLFLSQLIYVHYVILQIYCCSIVFMPTMWTR